MLSIRLPEDLEKRLEVLAAKTGRSKSFYVREAISEHLDEIEAAYLKGYSRTKAKRQYFAVGAPKPSSKLSRLVERPDVVSNPDDDLIDSGWEKEWSADDDFTG